MRNGVLTFENLIEGGGHILVFFFLREFFEFDKNVTEERNLGEIVVLVSACLFY